jgi:molybdopterin synthase sulfur carrier subunit
VVRVRLFAALRDAAGTSEVHLDPAPLGELLDLLRDRYGGRFTEVLGYASVMVDGERRTDPAGQVDDGAEVALLPPFSGGA